MTIKEVINFFKSLVKLTIVQGHYGTGLKTRNTASFPNSLWISILGILSPERRDIKLHASNTEVQKTLTTWESTQLLHRKPKQLYRKPNRLCRTLKKGFSGFSFWGLQRAKWGRRTQWIFFTIFHGTSTVSFLFLTFYLNNRRLMEAYKKYRGHITWPIAAT